MLALELFQTNDKYILSRGPCSLVIDRSNGAVEVCSCMFTFFSAMNPKNKVFIWIMYLHFGTWRWHFWFLIATNCFEKNYNTCLGCVEGVIGKFRCMTGKLYLHRLLMFARPETFFKFISKRMTGSSCSFEKVNLSVIYMTVSRSEKSQKSLFCRFPNPHWQKISR